MGTGQTLLTLGAIAIFMNMSMNLNRSYVTATQQTVDHQLELDAVNYGNSISELMYSQVQGYSELSSNYGHLDDVNDPSKRLDYTTVLGEELSATIVISSEQEVLQGVNGKVATITVYTWEDGSPIQKTKHLSPIIEL